MSEKSLLVAYCLWLFGGIFGLHHFYLGRDRHAIVWNMTLGGFVLGWLRDFGRLPYYVAEVNLEQEYVISAVFKRKMYEKPKSGTFRIIGEVVLAYYFFVIWRILFPENNVYDNIVIPYLVKLVLPLLVAIAIHTVGNIGEERVTLRPLLSYSFLGSTVYLANEELTLWVLIGIVMIVNSRAKSWRLFDPPSNLLTDSVASSPRDANCRGPEDRAKNRLLRDLTSGRLNMTNGRGSEDARLHSNWVVRLVLVGALCSLFWSVVWCALLFRGTIDSDGVKMSVKDFLTNNWSSIWNEMSWSLVWNFFKESMSPADDEAFKILGLSKSSASLESIRSHCRKLTSNHHPDRFPDALEKEIHLTEFIRLRQACDEAFKWATLHGPTSA